MRVDNCFNKEKARECGGKDRSVGDKIHRAGIANFCTSTSLGIFKGCETDQPTPEERQILTTSRVGGQLGRR